VTRRIHPRIPALAEVVASLLGVLLSALGFAFCCGRPVHAAAPAPRSGDVLT